jgi:hypothetical protein
MRPKKGDRVFTGRLGSDTRQWPTIDVVRAVPAPAGYWLVRLSGWKRDTWIELDRDPNGDNPYWLARRGRLA